VHHEHGRSGTGRDDGSSSRDPVSPTTISLWRALGVATVACLGVAFLETCKDLAFAGLAARDRTVAAAIRAQVPWWVLWIAFMPLVLILARRFRFDGPRWTTSALVHSAMGFTVALAHGVAFGLTVQLFVGQMVRPTLGAQVRLFLEQYLFTDLFTYCATVALYWSVEYFTHFRRSALAAARAEAEQARLQLRLADARLHALRMELNPHFLFNALNSVAGLVRRRDDVAAVEMLARLGDLLRTTLDREMPPEVTLAEEVALLRRYLDIELVRFGDRLRVVWDIAPEAWDACVPPLILQPVVENALRHGIARRSGTALLHVAARRVGWLLELEVRDSGEGLRLRPGAPVRQGIGLSNARARLDELYGAGMASVELHDASGGGARALVRIPYHVGRPTSGVASA